MQPIGPVCVSFLITSLIFFGGAVALLAGLLSRSMRAERRLRDIVKGTRRDTLRHLREAEHFRMACEHASDGILIQDMQGRVVWPNPAYCKIMGRPEEEMIGRNPLEFALPPDETPDANTIANFDFNKVAADLKGLKLFRNQRGDGTLFWNQISVSFRKSAVGEEHAILVCRDVTEQIEQEDRLRDARNKLKIEATRDSLTGVLNRAAFIKAVQRALASDDAAPVGLLHVDLDDFKAINDTHGHSAGDALLEYAAQVLRDGVREGDIVGRVGGDEFVVLCPDMASLDDLDALARRLVQAMATPVEWGNRRLSCTASIGAALTAAPDVTDEGLMAQSDFALYEAKRQGRNRSVTYDRRLYEQQTRLQHRAEELSDAIDTASLDHLYQPTINLDTGQIVSCETLVRWNHPSEGMVPPDQFLPLAQELGLMGPLDLGSMTAALQQKRLLNQSGHPEVGIAFNASPSLLAHPEFINRLVWGVEAGGIDRAQVTIEVLETTAFGDPDEMTSHAAVIRDLRAAGFQIQLDDFGVGYAGLAHLARLDVTGVKIDRTLIAALLNDETSHKIVRKIIELCNDLGLTVIAEGVEDIRTAVLLRRMGCKIIQGFWLSRPIPGQDLSPWLCARSSMRRRRRA